MVKDVRIIANTYRDSVTLMQLSAKVSQIEGIELASVVVASPMNLQLAREAGLLSGEINASPADLLIALQASNQESIDQAVELVNQSLYQEESASQQREEDLAPSLNEIITAQPGINMALISVPGVYAASEALKALKHNLQVMIFSDNVPVAEEIMLKKYAQQHGLMVMGPDCGTAIVAGLPLAFANVVRRGSIGIVAASGTGLQEVSTLIDDLGGGISHALGTGGRDLSEKVGGLSMLRGLEILADDADTKVILLISKPPEAKIVAKIIAQAKKIPKPVLVNFISLTTPLGLPSAATLKDAALLAVQHGGQHQPAASQLRLQPSPLVENWQPDAEQRYLRALYSGGTYAYEALVLLKPLQPLYSNLHADGVSALENVWRSQGHTVIDMGDDELTRGKPHPMIDYSFRKQRILQEAEDPQTAIILLDIVLGYGAHPDPAAELVPILDQAKETAARNQRPLLFLGRVCGTDLDPQGRAQQQQKLRSAGMLLFPSHTDMVNTALQLLREKK